MESFQKRERDRRNRQKRQDKLARRKERAEAKRSSSQQRVVSAPVAPLPATAPLASPPVPAAEAP